MATPFVMTALVWFVVRMYLNDLYISIPDRILVVAALEQLVQNIPTEVGSVRGYVHMMSAMEGEGVPKKQMK